MKTPDHHSEERPGFLRRILGKLFCCKPKEQDHLTDDEIRKSVGGMSATSTHQKPGKKEE